MEKEKTKQLKQVKFPKLDNHSFEQLDFTKEEILANIPDHEMVDAFLVNDKFENSFFNSVIKRADRSKYRKVTSE